MLKVVIKIVLLVILKEIVEEDDCNHIYFVEVNEDDRKIEEVIKEEILVKNNTHIEVIIF